MFDFRNLISQYLSRYQPQRINPASLASYYRAQQPQIQAPRPQVRQVQQVPAQVSVVQPGVLSGFINPQSNNYNRSTNIARF